MSGNRPPTPPKLMQMFEPRPYKNISELIGTMGNILIAGEKSQDSDFRERYLHLFDIMCAGLSGFVDKEFFADANKTLNVVKLLNPIIKKLEDKVEEIPVAVTAATYPAVEDVKEEEWVENGPFLDGEILDDDEDLIDPEDL